MSDCSPIARMGHSFLLHWSVAAHMGCFCLLAAENDAARTIAVPVVRSFGCIPWGGIAGSDRASACNFLENCQMVSPAAIWCYNPISNM